MVARALINAGCHHYSKIILFPQKQQRLTCEKDVHFLSHTKNSVFLFLNRTEVYIYIYTQFYWVLLNGSLKHSPPPSLSLTTA